MFFCCLQTVVNDPESEKHPRASSTEMEDPEDLDALPPLKKMKR